jgi:hypothetical protein
MFAPTAAVWLVVVTRRLILGHGQERVEQNFRGSGQPAPSGAADVEFGGTGKSSAQDN